MGVCGACTVLVDGELHASCITLAVAVEGAEVTTVEGIADDDGRLHPVQQAFIDHGGFQCGICTPGPSHRGQGPAGLQPPAHQGRNQALDDGQSLPLHRLLRHHQLGGCRRAPIPSPSGGGLGRGRLRRFVSQ